MEFPKSRANKDSKMLSNCKGGFIKYYPKFLTPYVEI